MAQYPILKSQLKSIYREAMKSALFPCMFSHPNPRSSLKKFAGMTIACEALLASIPPKRSDDRFGLMKPSSYISATPAPIRQTALALLEP